MPLRFLVIFLLVIISNACSGFSFARRSLDAVVNPQKYPVFKDICDSNCFNEAWESNPKWILSNLSHTAYYDKEKLCSTLVPFIDTPSPCPSVGDNDKAPLIRFYDVKSAQGFLVVWPDKAILSFRGTESKKLENLVKDASAYMSAEGTAKVHTGFKQSVDFLWEDYILPDLKRFAQGKPVWVTGHSLGGAMAVIAGMRYEFEDVVTFGQPRVGYGIGTEFKAKSHTRVVNGNDPVIGIIPAIESKYKHHGKEKRICDPINGANVLFDHAIGDYSNFLMSENNKCKK
jgi:hypothetical protein